MTDVLDHVTVTASDLGVSLRFYDAVLGALGLSRVVELGDQEQDDAALEAVAFGADGGPATLWLVGAAEPTHLAHFAFRAPDRAAVDAVHSAALTAGGTSRDAPRRWPIYRTGEYNTIVADPDGNLIEAVSNEL